MEKVVLWKIPEEETIPIPGDDTLWVLEGRQVENFCSNIAIDPQSKLMSTIHKTYSKKCRKYFEGERLVVEDACLKREFSYNQEKKALVLEASKVIGSANVSEAEKKEIPISEPSPQMKITVWTNKKLKQALEDVHSEFSAYDVQKILEALGILLPFRLEWKGKRTFLVQTPEKENLAEICFTNSNQIEVKQEENTVCYEIREDRFLKKVI